MGCTRPGQIMRYNSVLICTLVMSVITLFSATVEALAILSIICDGHGYADTIVVLNGIGLIILCPVTSIGLVEMRFSYCTLETCRRFRRARKAFRKAFGVDVLKCDDAEYVRQVVVSKLAPKVYAIKSMEAGPTKKCTEQVLRRMYDTGAEFVPMPTYTKMFNN